MVKFIIGIDEAGRGPLIGPLVMCAAAIPVEKEQELKALGVKDSKLLSEKQREDILKSMIGMLHYEVAILEPGQIDEAVLSKSTNLNWLEADTSAGLLNKMDAKLDNEVAEALIDCPSTNISAYTAYFRERTDNNNIKLRVEHKADFKYLIVGAASIIAKVTREKELEKIKKKLKIDFGSGYPADPKTRVFVEKYYDRPEYSRLFRKSWETYRSIAAKKAQRELGEY